MLLIFKICIMPTPWTRESINNSTCSDALDDLIESNMFNNLPKMQNLFAQQHLLKMLWRSLFNSFTEANGQSLISIRDVETYTS